MYKKILLSSSALVTAALVLTVSGCGHGVNFYIEHGNKLFSEGKYPDAAINYRKAIQKDGQSGEAHYRLGLTNLKLGNLSEASSELSHAENLLPNREDVKVEVAEFNLAVYLAEPSRPKAMYDKINEISGQLLRKDPRSYDGLRFKGNIAKSEGRWKDAEAALRQANAIKPMEPKTVIPLVEVLFQENETTAGVQLAEALLQKHKDYALAYDLLYRHYQAEKRFADGERILKLRLSNRPKDANVILQLAFHYKATGNIAASENALQQILSDPKDFPDGHLKVGEFYATLKNPDQALEHFRAGLQSDPKNKTAYFKKIASVLIAQQKREEALQTLDELLKSDPKDKDSRTMRAILWRQSGQPERLETALAELNELSSQNPSDAVLRYELGLTMERKGGLDGARNQYLETLKVRPASIQARIALVQVCEKRRQYEEMLRYADSLLTFKANNPQARLWRAIALMGTGNYASARAEMNRLAREYPQSTDIQLQLGLLNLGEKKYGDAEALFQKLYHPGQKDTRALEGLARSYVARKEFDKALQALTTELKHSPDSEQLHTLLAAAAQAGGKLDLALDGYRWLVERNPKSLEFQLSLAQICQAKGDVKNAIAELAKARAMAPKNGSIIAALALLEDASGQREKAKSTYQEALALDPQNSVFMNNLAFLLADTGGNLDQAMQLIEKAQRQTPNNPRFDDTLGWIYVKKNLNDGAIQILNNLVRKYPDDAGYRYHLGVALFQKGDKNAAKAELRTALARGLSGQTAETTRELIAKIG